jgi:hypothetical protein
MIYLRLQNPQGKQISDSHFLPVLQGGLRDDTYIYIPGR